MNKGIIWAVGLGLTAAWTFAEEIRVPVSLRGVIQSPTNQVTITDQSWVSAPGNRLVLLIDLQAGIVALEEWNADLTRQVDRDPVLNGTQPLLENFRMAFIPGRSPQLMANLEMVDLDWDGDGGADCDGNMQLMVRPTFDASGRVSRITAHLVGVFNDAINGVANVPPKIVRATLRNTGPQF
ncbi:MAG: hypothetical protein RMM51_07310 [Verrucomicrobiae bacterium]|nr:hypothetical protein [Verrucomicrobiae bacterium]